MPLKEEQHIKKVTESSLILRQSNKISRSPTVPGLRQAKAYRYLLMRARDHLLQGEFHVVYQEELKNFLGSNDWENLKESIEALRKIDVRWDLLPQKGESDELLWGSSPLLADCEIRKDKNGRIYFKYSFSPKMREELSNPKFFRDFDLNIIREFQSSYSLKFYEFCFSAINPQSNYVMTEFIPKEKFWELLGLKEGEYKNYYNFKSRVIKPALKEVNELTDLQIDIERVKRGPSRYDFRFKIKRQAVQTRLKLDDEKMKSAYEKFHAASIGTQNDLKEEFLIKNPSIQNKSIDKNNEKVFFEWIAKNYP